MGDVIHALPAITALRAANPDLEIGWLVEERWAELLCARESDRMAARSPQKPLVDRVHIANFKAWRRALLSDESWRAMKSLRSEVRAMKYDLALDLQGAMRSALAGKASGAATRVGSSQPREKPATLFYTRQVDPRGAHVVEQALAIVSEIAGQATAICRPGVSARIHRRGLGRSNLKPARQSAVCHSESRRGLGNKMLAGGILWRSCVSVAEARIGRCS